MAVIRVTPTGWLQETTTTVSRATPSGWVQETTGVSAATITAGAGTFTLIGTATGLTTARRLTADAQSYALTGIAATLTKTGSYSITGGVASFALNSNAAGLVAARTLAADVQAYMLGGVDATLTKTASHALTAEAASFTLQGQAADFAGWQHAYPVSDVSAGSWVPSSGSDLYAMLDDGYTADDGDYVYTASLSTALVALTARNDPGVHTGHMLYYRAKGDGSTDLVVRLKDGDTTIATWTEANVSTGWTTYGHALTIGEAANIQSYATLRVELEAA